MTIQLIGAGFGRTGTLSLKSAIETLLGGTCHHMIEVFATPEQVPAWTYASRGTAPDWQELLSDYCAIVDFPGAVFWEEIAEAYPDAPVLLSTRESPQVWWESASNTIFAGGRDRMPPEFREFMNALYSRISSDVTNAAATKAAYEAHIDRVRATVPPERLFEYQPGDGWAPLCAALNVPVPDHDFPHSNTRAEFRAMAKLDEPSTQADEATEQ